MRTTESYEAELRRHKRIDRDKEANIFLCIICGAVLALALVGLIDTINMIILLTERIQ